MQTCARALVVAAGLIPAGFSLCSDMSYSITVQMSVYSAIFMSIHMSIHMPVHMSVHMHKHMSIHMSVHMTSFVSLHMSAQMSICQVDTAALVSCIRLMLSKAHPGYCVPVTDTPLGYGAAWWITGISHLRR